MLVSQDAHITNINVSKSVNLIPPVSAQFSSRKKVVAEVIGDLRIVRRNMAMKL